MCAPATPTTAVATRAPEDFSASDTAARIASTVASMLTTTPLRNPLHGTTPCPSSPIEPSAAASATSAQTLLVPTSRAASTFLIGVRTPLAGYAAAGAAWSARRHEPREGDY